MGLAEGKVKQHSRICSRHFRNGDPANGPEKTLGEKFASPKNYGAEELKELSKEMLYGH